MVRLSRLRVRFRKPETSLTIRVLVFFAVALVLSAPVITDSDFGVRGDQPYHYYAAKAFVRCLMDGDLVPRWAGILDGGRGNTLFTFYSPLYYWLAGILVLGAGLEVLTALKCLSLLTIVLCQWTAFLFARRFFNHPLSFLVAISYVTLPAYAFISQYSCFLPNGLALGILPLWFMGLHLVLGGESCRSGPVILVIAGSALILTHTITAYLAWFALVPMIARYWPQSGWLGIRNLSICLLVILALTAFFWIPILVERPWIQLDHEIAKHTYNDYLLFASPTASTPYGLQRAEWNYAGSLITILQLSLLLTLWLAGRSYISKTSLHLWAGFCIAIGIAGIAISLPSLGSVWSVIPGFEFIQFPWRMQPFVALAVSFLLAAVLQKWNVFSYYKRLMLFGLLFFLILPNLLLTWTLASASRFGQANAVSVQMLHPRYRPPIDSATNDDLVARLDPAVIPYLSNRVPYRPKGSDSGYHSPVDNPGEASIVAGEGRIAIKKHLNSHREYVVTCLAPVSVRIETYSYPNWVVRRSGQKIELKRDSQEGLIRLDLPAGRHLLTMDFVPLRRSESAGGWVSALAWISLLSWGLYLFSHKIET